MSSPLVWQIQPAHELADIASVWNALNRADSDLPIMDAEFWTLALQYFGHGDESLVVGNRNDQPIAAGIFRPASRLARNMFQPSQAPLGPWLVDPACDLKMPDLLRSLKNAFGVSCALVGITQQDPRYHTVSYTGSSLQHIVHIRTAAINTVGSFEEYWQQRAKKLRQNMRTQRNHLQRDGTTTRMEVITGPDAMPAAVEAYAVLEQSGWKAEKGTAVNYEGEQGQFYVAMMQAYAARGEAMAYQYYLDENLVASDLCVQRRGIVILLKTAFDSSIRQLSPSLLMKEELYREYFESPVIERMEFYGPLIDWQTRWTADIRELYHLNYVNTVARAIRAVRRQD